MTLLGPVVDRLARATHPRLLLLVLVGAGLVVVGLSLWLLAPTVGLGDSGARIAILGALVFFLGASGYLAFAVFEHAPD